jgi:hypothetical protein
MLVPSVFISVETSLKQAGDSRMILSAHLFDALVEDIVDNHAAPILILIPLPSSAVFTRIICLKPITS